MTTGEIICRLLIAGVCGAIVGINRDLHHKAAGFRTISLVSIGSALVTLTGTQLTSDPAAVSRIMQGIMTGIGFLGAGVILHPRAPSRVLGLTTAAAVWLTAGLGVICGLGLYRIALIGLGVALLALMIGGPIEKFLERIVRKLHGDPKSTMPTSEAGAAENDAGKPPERRPRPE